VLDDDVACSLPDEPVHLPKHLRVVRGYAILISTVDVRYGSPLVPAFVDRIRDLLRRIGQGGVCLLALEVTLW